MKSIKPGRGPSFMSGVGSIFVALFGVIWTFGAASMGAPGIFPLFGIVFIIMAIVQGVYNFKNATSKNRYSSYDITDSKEEPDPWNERFYQAEGLNDEGHKDTVEAEHQYCPYCGSKVQTDFEFCNQCGKKLP